MDYCPTMIHGASTSYSTPATIAGWRGGASLLFPLQLQPPPPSLPPDLAEERTPPPPLPSPKAATSPPAKSGRWESVAPAAIRGHRLPHRRIRRRGGHGHRRCQYHQRPLLPLLPDLVEGRAQPSPLLRERERERGGASEREAWARGQVDKVGRLARRFGSVWYRCQFV